VPSGGSGSGGVSEGEDNSPIIEVRARSFPRRDDYNPVWSRLKLTRKTGLIIGSNTSINLRGLPRRRNQSSPDIPCSGACIPSFKYTDFIAVLGKENVP
tara:strand:- start:2271 stop:2567 length:297 start_codon:yes stop_codon:yes gene_type:complete